MQQSGAPDTRGQKTRELLLERLRHLRRGASTRELAEYLDLHVNGVRRHLESLELTGAVQVRKAKGRRGRPRLEWSLAPGGWARGSPPRRYEDLARWLGSVVESGSLDEAEIEAHGREIGSELAPEAGASPPRRLQEALTALGFDPVLEPAPEGQVRCRLCNCPYLETARESPGVVCTLHRGITAGLVEALEPSARLEHWEPQDPDEAGCVAEIAGTAWAAELVAGQESD